MWKIEIARRWKFDETLNSLKKSQVRQSFKSEHITNLTHKVVEKELLSSRFKHWFMS